MGPNARRNGVRSRQSAETVSSPVTAVVTILAALLGAGVLAVGVDAVVPSVVAALTGPLLTGTITATKRRTPGGRAIGSALAVLAALGATVAVGLAVVGAPTAVDGRSVAGVVLAVVLISFGATATLTGAVGDGAVRSAVPVVVLTMLPLPVMTAATTAPIRRAILERLTGGSMWGWLGLDRLRAWLFAPADPLHGLAALSVLLVALLWSARFVLPRLALLELLPRDRRRDLAPRLRRLASRAGLLGWVALLVGIGANVVDSSPQLSSPVDLEAYAVVDAVLTAPALGWLAFAGVLALWALWLVSKLPVLRTLRYNALVRWSPAFVGGTVLALAVAVVYPALFERTIAPRLAALPVDRTIPLPIAGATTPPELASILSPPEGTAIVTIAAVWMLGVVLALLGAVVLVGALRLLPDRAAPGSLVAGALVFGGVFAAAAGAHPAAVVVPVACAIVAWDGAVYGVSLTEELGTDVSARRPALSHATASALVGALGVGLALGLYALVVGSVAVPAGGAVALLLSITLALLASLVALKRRDAASAKQHEDGDSRDGKENRSLERLEDVAGVTPALAHALRRAGYESIEDLAAASRDELHAVEGVSRPVAARIATKLEASDVGADPSGDGTERRPTAVDEPPSIPVSILQGFPYGLGAYILGVGILWAVAATSFDIGLLPRAVFGYGLAHPFVVVEVEGTVTLAFEQLPARWYALVPALAALAGGYAFARSKSWARRSPPQGARGGAAIGGGYAFMTTVWTTFAADLADVGGSIAFGSPSVVSVAVASALLAIVCAGLGGALAGLRS